MAHKGNYSNDLRRGSMGHQTPAPVDGDQDFTVSGDAPQRLGEDGQADIEGEQMKEADAALAEFASPKRGARYSSLKKYDGERTSIPTEPSMLPYNEMPGD